MLVCVYGLLLDFPWFTACFVYQWWSSIFCLPELSSKYRNCLTVMQYHSKHSNFLCLKWVNKEADLLCYFLLKTSSNLYIALYFAVLKDCLCSMWKHRPAVSVICTSKSRTSLHAKLTPTHGNHVFHITEEIPSLNQVCHHYYVGYLCNFSSHKPWHGHGFLLSVSDIIT